MNEKSIVDVIKNRRSIRFFKNPDTLKDEDINKILQSAIYAPSAKNLQPIEFILIKDKKMREELAKACHQPQPKQVPVSIVVIGNLKIAGSVGKISTHSITTKSKGQKKFLYMDGAACIMNMLLIAESLGLSTLWISSLQPEKIAELMKLPPDYVALAVICIGHKAKPPLAPRKVPLDERLHYEMFNPQLKRDEIYLDDCRKINEPEGEYKIRGEKC